MHGVSLIPVGRDCSGGHSPAGVNRGTTQCYACSFVCFLTSACLFLVCLPDSFLIFPGFLLLEVERGGRLNPILLPFLSIPPPPPFFW